MKNCHISKLNSLLWKICEAQEITQVNENLPGGGALS